VFRIVGLMGYFPKYLIELVQSKNFGLYNLKYIFEKLQNLPTATLDPHSSCLQLLKVVPGPQTIAPGVPQYHYFQSI